MPHGFRFWSPAAMRLPGEFLWHSSAKNLMPLCDEAFHFAFRLHLEHQRTQRLQDISGLYFVDASH